MWGRWETLPSGRVVHVLAGPLDAEGLAALDEIAAAVFAGPGSVGWSRQASRMCAIMLALAERKREEFDG